MKTIAKENRAFFMWAKENYGEHPIGELLLATYLYECCRQHSDSIAWDIMKLVADKFTSEAFLKAAQMVLKEDLTT